MLESFLKALLVCAWK